VLFFFLFPYLELFNAKTVTLRAGEVIDTADDAATAQATEVGLCTLESS
jgi:hypothetical protein